MTSLVAVTSVTVAGCGLSVSDLPMPKPNPAGEGYTITADFDNALNLPTDAKVKSGGADIGSVENISTKNYKASVEMKIKKEVILPEGTTAELRQATPLGDVFISLTLPPADQAGPPIKDGGRLDNTHTKAAATVEELLSQASILINGGALTRAVDVLNQISSAVAGKDQTLVDTLNRLTSMITTINGRTESLDGTLNQTTELMNTLNNNKKKLGDVADSLPGTISVLATNNQNLGNAVRSTAQAFDALGDFSATSTGAMNVLLQSTDKITTAVNVWDDHLAGLADKIHALEPRIRVNTESSAVGTDLVLGALSIGVLYDTGSRLPTLGDVNLLVISMTYMLQKAYAKFAGSNR
ncbi:MlaD family protein [Smaragdicoccus niigatensis]|uniref:MlaD family protein n=1 Tax=Smaragdicoccus niigatensis TaxID=359359 RepID=UPI00138ABC63|nr:MCE family protein [Smaragdicoccus niigatensis]